MEELINEIELTEFSHLFENIHEDNFDDTLHYTLKYKKFYLEIDFKLYVDFTKDYEVKKSDIDIEDIKIWVNDTVKVQITYPMVQKIELQMLKSLKELY